MKALTGFVAALVYLPLIITTSAAALGANVSGDAWAASIIVGVLGFFVLLPVALLCSDN